MASTADAQHRAVKTAPLIFIATTLVIAVLFDDSFGIVDRNNLRLSAD